MQNLLQRQLAGETLTDMAKAERLALDTRGHLFDLTNRGGKKVGQISNIAVAIFLNIYHVVLFDMRKTATGSALDDVTTIYD